VFVCPSSNAEKWDFGRGNNTALNWSNWEGAAGVQEHLSYSYQNPYPDDEAMRKGFKLNNSTGAEFAVAADINPGSDKNGKGVLTVKPTSRGDELRAGNSPNHDGDGQNVLFGDGHVEFVQNPFVGVQKDNLYARRAGYDMQDLASDTIWASPRDAGDSVLLPTAR
jgi:prepilin-type processing-associated H-X9-DG protein